MTGFPFKKQQESQMTGLPLKKNLRKKKRRKIGTFLQRIIESNELLEDEIVFPLKRSL